MLFSFMQEALRDLPMNILVGVADEVLVTLKNDKMSSKEKKKQKIPLAPMGVLADGSARA